jgi:hypothetical protein
VLLADARQRTALAEEGRGRLLELDLGSAAERFVELLTTLGGVDDGRSG